MIDSCDKISLYTTVIESIVVVSAYSIFIYILNWEKTYLNRMLCALITYIASILVSLFIVPIMRYIYVYDTMTYFWRLFVGLCKNMIIPLISTLSYFSSNIPEILAFSLSYIVYNIVTFVVITGRI